MDKRIDILATAIKGHLTIFDLPELELTYAPPFGSAKDPVNMLGYAAMNIAEGLSETVQWHELPTELAKENFIRCANSRRIGKGQIQGSQTYPFE